MSALGVIQSLSKRKMHRPNPAMVALAELRDRDLNASARLQVRPLGNLKGSDQQTGREKRSILA
jgi:tRNA (Thr-GGU) A37 N-methylase